MLHFLCTGGVSGLSCAGDPLVLPARLIGSQTFRHRLTAASGVVMPKKGWVWEGRQAEPVQTGHFALGPTSEVLDSSAVRLEETVGRACDQHTSGTPISVGVRILSHTICPSFAHILTALALAAAHLSWSQPSTLSTDFMCQEEDLGRGLALVHAIRDSASLRLRIDRLSRPSQRQGHRMTRYDTAIR